MKSFVAALVLASTVLVNVNAASAEPLKYYKPGVFDWNQFWNSPYRGA